MKNEKWFELSVQQIEQKLKTNAASGLSRKAARSRVGKNIGSVFVVKRQTIRHMIGRIFSDFSLLLLLFASVISLFFDEYRTGYVVLGLLFCNLVIAFFLHYYSTRAMEQNSSRFYPQTRVIRGGKLFYVHEKELVPGDVILIEQGDILCCDARLVNSDRLRVRMRIDRDRTQELDKYAEGYVRADECHAQEMTNMVHAGSLVLEGNARAIVIATGSYTYLGAMTGGIPFPTDHGASEKTRRLSARISKWNLGFLLAILPVCLIGLWVSHSRGGTVLLSTAFWTLMSLIVTGTSQVTCTMSSYFYVKEIRGLLDSRHPCAIRSLDAFEKLGQINYLFVQDGAILSDGIWHFQGAYCDQWEMKEFVSSPQRIRQLGETVALYHMASTQTLTTGVGGSSKYDEGIRQFLMRTKIDQEALRIRCKVISYLPGNLGSDGEKICIVDSGKKIWISISSNSKMLQACTCAESFGGRKMWSTEDREIMLHVYDELIANHQVPLIFTELSENGTDKDSAFIGMIALKEGIDEKRMTHIQALAKKGCQVITFSNKGKNPAVPFAVSHERIVTKEDFIKRNLPLHYRLGWFHRYVNFESTDVEALMDHIHQNGETVALVCFSDLSETLASKAELLISCSTVGREKSLHVQTEANRNELPSESVGSTCVQTIQRQANVLVPRPIQQKGGLASLVAARFAINKSEQAFDTFLQYLLISQIVRGTVAVLPLLMGNPLIDARHILLCGVLWDFTAFFGVAWGKNRDGGIQKISKNEIYLSIISSLLMLLLPILMDWSGVFGPYLYRTEYVFVSMMLLHFSILLSFSFRNRGRTVNKRILWLGMGLGILFLLICFIVSSFGGLWSIEKLPLPYFLVSFIPALCFGVVSQIKYRKRKGSVKNE